MKVKNPNESLIRTKTLINQLIQKLKTYLNRTLQSKNILDKLVRPGHKFAKSPTKTNSKVREPKTYDEAIHNSVYGNKQ